MSLNAYKSWIEEKRSAYLYRIVAEKETDTTLRKLFSDLASAADDQADVWMKQMPVDARPKDFHPDVRTRVVSWLIRCWGARRTRTILAAMKVRGMSVYFNPIPTHPMPRTVADIERHHKSFSNGTNLRAAVFGINDGLISNVSLILGVSAASHHPSFVIVSGVAGLLAGACSMGSGEYVSVLSQRELFEYQIELERKELEIYPEEEAEELALIYEARGLPADEARKVASMIIKNPEKALDTLAREELGLNPSDLGSPIGAGLASFFSFALGAFIPLVPFFFTYTSSTLLFSIGLTAISLFIVGATLSLFTNCTAWWAGTRMLLIGIAAGSATYLIGSLLGVTLG